LERVAGFRLRSAIVVSPDPWGYGHGYGRRKIAITLWSRIGSKSAVLVISAAGGVTRASPAYRAGGGEGAVSGWSWSPDGRKLFVLAEVVPPKWRGPGDHDHCLDIWNPELGRRRAFCASRLPPAYRSHFARLVWAAGGGRGLLDNGTFVTGGGRVTGRLDVPSLAFEFQLQPTGT
jgi:hypothetical protein